MRPLLLLNTHWKWAFANSAIFSENWIHWLSVYFLWEKPKLNSCCDSSIFTLLVPTRTLYPSSRWMAMCPFRFFITIYIPHFPTPSSALFFLFKRIFSVVKTDSHCTQVQRDRETCVVQLVSEGDAFSCITNTCPFLETNYTIMCMVFVGRDERTACYILFRAFSCIAVFPFCFAQLREYFELKALERRVKGGGELEPFAVVLHALNLWRENSVQPWVSCLSALYVR